MKTINLQSAVVALLAAPALLVAGCNAQSATPTNAAAKSDPLMFKPAPEVPQLPVEGVAQTTKTSDGVTVENAVQLTEERALPVKLEISPALADVVKLVQSNVGQEVVLTFIRNSAGRFNIGAEQMDYLSDLGVGNEIALAMIQRDYALAPQMAPAAVLPGAVTPVATQAVVAAAVETVPAPPVEQQVVVVTEPPPVTVNYFYESLSPYGSWIEVDGYGRCWQPTVVVHQSSWRPYSDNGHWVYSNHGWYWVSDYSWGATFHYGRWFNHPGRGWCWTPDTAWGPAWVTWRASSDYCGWAPLPPRTRYVSGVGLTFNGGAVSVGFSFGLGADCYTFVPRDRFWDRRPHHYALSRGRTTQVINQTTVINNYVRGDNNQIINRGIARESIVGNNGRNAGRPQRGDTAAINNPGSAGANWRNGRTQGVVSDGQNQSGNRSDNDRRDNDGRDNGRPGNWQNRPGNGSQTVTTVGAPPTRPNNNLPETGRHVPSVTPPGQVENNRPGRPVRPVVSVVEAPANGTPNPTPGTNPQRGDNWQTRPDRDGDWRSHSDEQSGQQGLGSRQENRPGYGAMTRPVTVAPAPVNAPTPAASQPVQRPAGRPYVSQTPQPSIQPPQAHYSRPQQATDNWRAPTVAMQRPVQQQAVAPSPAVPRMEVSRPQFTPPPTRVPQPQQQLSAPRATPPPAAVAPAPANNPRPQVSRSRNQGDDNQGQQQGRQHRSR